MKCVLNREVFVLNRAWQLINCITVQAALSQMAAGAATALDMQEDGNYAPVSWDAWLQLPLRNEDECIRTSKSKVRMPTVIVAVNYAKVPKRRPKFTLKNLARTYNSRCAYTGELLSPDQWSKDHVIPLSRGGKDVPENVVLAGKKVNNKKANKLPHEAGLPAPVIKKLGVAPFVPTHPDHQVFIK